MLFQQWALNVPQIPRFLHLFASRSQSKPTKNTGIYSVLTRQHAKKHDVFEQFFTLFQPMLLRSKNAYFLLFFCHRSSGLKKALKKKGPPPPAKADCVSASGKTRPFAPTVRADLFVSSFDFFCWLSYFCNTCTDQCCRILSLGCACSIGCASDTLRQFFPVCFKHLLMLSVSSKKTTSKFMIWWFHPWVV